ncbi:hypothetical protein COU77_02965 [Candidatus Peregrinibacteria bacterium CG10_big_fil_rev_8_21_14_0_10_49_16]|nr:MAG: hypothetical protein COW95_02480 [Candidatus Peregrinibacteria bacterium CG22_combo_CG10-13_8_21_14_all_49_11]PIR51996.1 MAG: hypothetical protein COU77_02965 [Candidatus Peregrinibacteria bacterium CG10_big_fil_rev_8_21_14_0_10_49_16]
MIPLIFNLGTTLLSHIVRAQGFVSDFGEKPPRSTMSYVLPFVGMGFSFILVKYRERIGDMLGEAHWMVKIGGVYYVLVYIAIIIFFWSIAELTDTTHIFLAPLTVILPFGDNKTDF